MKVITKVKYQIAWILIVVGMAIITTTITVFIGQSLSSAYGAVSIIALLLVVSTIMWFVSNWLLDQDIKEGG